MPLGSTTWQRFTNYFPNTLTILSTSPTWVINSLGINTIGEGGPSAHMLLLVVNE